MSDGNGYKAAEFRGMMIQKMDHVIQKLEEMSEQHASDNRKLHVRIDKHEAYHKENEHRWGFYALLKRKPILGFFIGVGVSGSLASLGYNMKELIKTLIKLL